MNTQTDDTIELKETLQKQKLSLVLENNLSSSLGNFGVALLITLIFDHFMDNNVVYGWFFYMILISILRLFIGNHLYKTIQKGEYKPLFERIVYVLVTLTAMGWGTASILFINAENIATNPYLAIAIAGIVAGSTASLIPIKKYFFSFVVLALVPTLFSFFVMGGIENYYFSLMILLFILFMYRNGRIFSANISHNFELIYKNQNLIDNLKIEKNKALEASELKSQFLANMSHEVRTPMNAILGFIHLLREKEVDSKKLSYLETVIHSSENLLNIINDILDFSKIESNQLPIEKKSFNPNDTLQNSLNLFQDAAVNKNIQLEFVCKNTLPKNVISDEFRLAQVLNNLLSNAIKFSPENVNVVLEAYYDFDKGELSVAVYDEGIGIAKERQKEIFNAFYQVDASTTRKYGGTGLGLSISSMLIKMLGGKLEVESTLNKGSKFFFSIKAPIDQAIPVKPTIQQQADFKSINGHVLVVEDVLLNQKLIIALLNKFGLTYEVANDGIEAVDAYQKDENGEFSLILMDENMPNMSGIEATRKIREIEAQNKKPAIPIIAVTANALEGDRERFLTEGFDEYITKPINAQLLYEALEKYTDNPEN